MNSTLGFERYKVSKDCEGDFADKESKATVFDCADACLGVSKMFIYGKNTAKVITCGFTGCRCKCPLLVINDGECLKMKEDSNFDLYRYEASEDQGKLLIFVKCRKRRHKVKSVQ